MVSAMARARRAVAIAKARLSGLRLCSSCGFGVQVAATFAACAIGLLLATLAFAWVYFGRTLQDADQERHHADVRRLAERTGNVVAAFSSTLSVMRNNERVRSALADTRMIEPLLTPFLALARAAFDAQAGLGVSHSWIALLDYRGRVVAGVAPPDRVPGTGLPWVPGALERETPHAEFEQASSLLVVGFPVRFGQTARPEGMLVGWLDLGAVAIEAMGAPAPQLPVIRKPHDAPSSDDTQELRLPAMLQPLRLQLALPWDGSHVEKQLENGLISLFFIMFLTSLAGAALSLLAAARLSRPVTALTQWAETVAASDQTTVTVAPREPYAIPELNRLATLLDEAIRKQSSLRDSAELDRQRLLDGVDANRLQVWETDREGRLVWSSNQGVGLSGRPWTSGLGLVVGMGAIIQEDRSAFHAALRGVIDEDQPMQEQIYRLEHVSGREHRWISVSARAYRDASGRILGARGVSLDVTERVRTETERSDIADRLRQAQEVARIGSWHLDMQSDAITWSNESHAYQGCSPAPRSAWSAFSASCTPPTGKRCARHGAPPKPERITPSTTGSWSTAPNAGCAKTPSSRAMPMAPSCALEASARTSPTGSKASAAWRRASAASN